MKHGEEWGKIEKKLKGVMATCMKKIIGTWPKGESRRDGRKKKKEQWWRYDIRSNKEEQNGCQKH